MPWREDRHLTSEHFRAFTRVIDKAIELDVDMLLIAGDFFDSNRASEVSTNFALEQLARLGRPAIIGPGNHDCFDPGSVYHRVDFGQAASEGEKLFIKQAGGDAVDRMVRNQVDFDNAQILRKNRSFADAILSFGATPTEPLVDPAAEAARIKAAEDANKDVVGVGKVVIQPKHTSKLPGL